MTSVPATSPSTLDTSFFQALISVLQSAPTRASSTPMPPRGSPAAPTFVPNNPRSVRQFFQDLEFLFTQSGITSDLEKKRYAKAYAPFDDAEVWTTLREYSTSSYPSFVSAVYQLYPGSSPEEAWRLTDLNRLIQNTRSNSLKSEAEVASYHRQFLAISEHLTGLSYLDKQEQLRKYEEGFP